MWNRMRKQKREGGAPTTDSRKSDTGAKTGLPSHPLMTMNRRFGNQAVQTLLAPGASRNARLSTPGDRYEREADKTADRVTRTLDKPAREMRGDDGEGLQTRTIPAVNHAAARALPDSGKPVPEEVRRDMEPRFGYDFGNVRLHTDREGGQMARALNARAFTMGRDVVFAEGQYAPETTTGRKLLAHELSHVVQQTSEAGLMHAGLALVQRDNGTFLGASIHIDLDVPLIPQPTPLSCWAAALAMVVSYRDNTMYTPQEIANHAGMDLATGYGWTAISGAVLAWGLSETPPMSAMPPYWASLLEEHGPLWVVEVGAPYHAVVVKGMHGTGDPDSTEVWINNPWPPNQGAVEYKTFMDFEREFNLGAGAGAMIVHA